MSDIPLELIADILLRLAVKSLLRFRCVSKLWRALIDGPDFIKSHLNRSINTKSNLSIIFSDYYAYSIDFDSLDHVVDLDPPLKSYQFGTVVVGSCNGLLCLYNRMETVAIWNPSTRKHRKVPATPVEVPNGFHWCNSSVIHGFGYDVVSDDYKLVRMVRFYGIDVDVPSYFQVNVYSLKSNLWKRVDFPYYLQSSRAPGVLVGGALHWVVHRRPKSDRANLIAAFDLGTEESRLVELPEFTDTKFYMNLKVLDGSLCVICSNSYRVDLWVMKSYGVKDSWTKLFSVPIPIDTTSAFLCLSPITCSKSGGEVLLLYILDTLSWYDLRRETLKDVTIHDMPCMVDPFTCWGSLVPLGEDAETDGHSKQEQDSKEGYFPHSGVQAGASSDWKCGCR